MRAVVLTRNKMKATRIAKCVQVEDFLVEIENSARVTLNVGEEKKYRA